MKTQFADISDQTWKNDKKFSKMTSLLNILPLSLCLSRTETKQKDLTEFDGHFRIFMSFRRPWNIAQVERTEIYHFFSSFIWVGNWNSDVLSHRFKCQKQPLFGLVYSDSARIHVFISFPFIDETYEIRLYRGILLLSFLFYLIWRTGAWLGKSQNMAESFQYVQRYVIKSCRKDDERNVY